MPGVAHGAENPVGQAQLLHRLLDAAESGVRLRHGVRLDVAQVPLESIHCVAHLRLVAGRRQEAAAYGFSL